MNFPVMAPLIVLGMLVGTLLMLETGRRLGECRLARDPESAKAGAGAIEGAVFGLLGLLIAFTFSGAASRYDARRLMITEEASTINTAWLRLDVLPAADQPPLREKFRQYLDARLVAFHKLPDVTAATVDFKRAGALQNEIWALAVAACREPDSQFVPRLVLPALNDMFTTAAMRTAGATQHPPLLIYLMLGMLLLAASLLAGYGLGVGKVRYRLHGLAFVLAMTLAVYVIVNFEFPRGGIIRIDRFEKVLVDLRQSMNP
jgi:hypothetical protein